MHDTRQSGWTTTERASLPAGRGNQIVISKSTRRRRYDGREEHRAVLRVHFLDGGQSRALFIPIEGVPELVEKLGDLYREIEGEDP